jgi:hypothetical protein
MKYLIKQKSNKWAGNYVSTCSGDVMWFLWGTNWVFICKKAAFFIVTAVKTSNLKSNGVFFFVVLELFSWICASHFLLLLPSISGKQTNSGSMNTYHERRGKKEVFMSKLDVVSKTAPPPHLKDQFYFSLHIHRIVSAISGWTVV